MTTRRQFLATTGSAAAFNLLPGSALGANEKLHVAFIGMGGQIQGHVRNVIGQGHHVIALCDVDKNQIAGSKQRHGDAVTDAREYGDYRKLFEQEKHFDAVVIATPDHWHFDICKAAIEAGKHVYCEKPLTHTVGEARALRELSKKSKVITQTGNQGSASPNLRRSMELIEAGLFGEISEVHVWHPAHGWPCGVNRPEQADATPAHLDWDFWLGPAPERPFNSGIYHPAKWRGWYDFGNGSVGDFCCHSFNLPVRALKLDYPDRIEFSGTELGKESYAKSVTHTFRFPAIKGRGPVVMKYYTGGDLPPEETMKGVVATFGNIPRVGCLMVGDKGELSAGLWNSQCYVRLKGEEKFFGHGNHEAAKAIPISLPRVSNHLVEWVDAIKGGAPTFANFDFGGHLTEIGLAGNIALRLQQPLDWDGPAMKAKGLPGADALVHKEKRKPYI